MEVGKSSVEEQEMETKIWDYIYGFAGSLVLKCAVELEIADIIHKQGEPMTLSELTSQLPVDKPIDSSRLYRVMRYLVHMKLFTKEINVNGEVKYGLAPSAGKFLVRRSDDKSMATLILGAHQEAFMAPWHHLKESLSHDSSSSSSSTFEKALGKSIWDYMGENPEKNQLFNECMASDSRRMISALISDCRNVFEGLTTLVDVGGGPGTAAKSISKAFPHIKCTVYDLPHVVADYVSSDTDIVWIEGDMFKYIPSADAILMKWILHCWGEEECIQILKRCKEAVPKGGKVIIVDIVIDDKSEHPYTKTRLTFDLDMMLNTGGKERTEEEWKKMILAAGFTTYKITQISALQSVIEAYP